MVAVSLPNPVEILIRQKELYEGDFYRRGRWRWTFRDDCRYRWHRLREYLTGAGFSLEQQRVLELGFGSGDLLLLFSTSCTLMGIELSQSAVDAIGQDPRLAHYRHTWFRALRPDGAMPEPPHQADILLNSHMLEHVPDPQAALAAALPALKPGGLVVTFVPLEEPGFDPKHVRTYTPASLRRLMDDLDLEVLHLEENYRICCGPMRWAEHPARHDWPLFKSLEGLRNILLTSIPYNTTRAIEELLLQAGVKASQAMVVARKG